MILYKYRNMNDPNLKNMILKQEIFFSRPDSFNDPFDSCPSIEFEGSKKELSDYFVPIFQKLQPNWPENKVRAFFNKRYKPKKFIDDKIGDIKSVSLLDGLKTFCMSKTNSNVLMWSHYADYHRGICLGFEALSEKSIFYKAKEVKYTTERLQINLIKAHTELLKLAEQSLFEKSKDWENEKEMRIVDPEIEGVYNYNIDELREVIFGEKISEDNIAKVRGWMNELNHNPSFYKAKLHPKKYEMEIFPIV